MGWVMLLAFALFTGALLALLRFPRPLWMVAATALTLGAAGYAWQGNPDLPGSPVSPEQKKAEIDPGLIQMREAVFGRFNLEDTYFRQSDAMTRIGAKDSAVRSMMNATINAPTDGALWTWYGMALADYGDGMVSPASRLAFERGIRLWPQHPGPYYFLGVALIRGGQPAEARQYWAKAVELAPPAQAYRAPMVAQLAELDAFLASNGVSPPSK